MMKTKKPCVRNIFLILSLSTLVFLIFFYPEPKEKADKSFEEKIIDAIEFDSFHEGIIKNIVLLDDFADGYICVALDKDDRLVFSYIKKVKYNEVGLDEKATVFESNELYINNTDPLKIFDVPLVNFSRYSLYFGCCRSENFDEILINGEPPKIYNAEITISDSTYNMDFWFAISKNKPTVEFVK